MPRVLTIAPSSPFLPTLARALLDGGLVEGFAPRGDLFALSGATVFLPTRRAGRAFAEALRTELGGGAILLPKIVPLGDVDEDALAFSEDASPLAAPHGIAPVHRRIILANLIGRWRDALAEGEGRAAVAAGPAATFALADALAHLFDDFTTAGVDLAALKAIVPEEHDCYFEVSLEFVRLVRRHFSAYLAEAGLVEPAVRRDALVAAEAARLTSLGAGAGPVIAAGSTGSLPATARLLRAISRLPLGCVVLPGLDLALDAASFALLTDPGGGAPDHPQFGLARLLGTLEVTRADVAQIGRPAQSERDLLIGEALRPAETSDLWSTLSERLPSQDADAAMAGVTVIAADDPREEALAIALVLRDALETPGATAALVTPDRDLARRVTGELARFGVAIDDSAGIPLAETSAGRLARLMVEAVADDLAPVALFALLSHPLARLGLAEEDKAEALAALEIDALRGPRPEGGIAGLRAALAARGEPGAAPAERLARARDLVARLDTALAPLLALDPARETALSTLIAAHAAAFAALAGPLDAAAEDPGEAALAAVFAEMGDVAGDGPALTLADYAQTLVALLSDRMVRPRGGASQRLAILGPIEARLLSPDRVVLGSLVERTWPTLGETDPWLSRPMRAALGLDLPERRIGLAAHDFAQGCGAREVVLTYPAKVAGTQSVVSRFVQRLQTVAGTARWEAARARGDRWRRAAARLDAAPPVPRVPRPAPAPPLHLRPRRLSVTEVETFLRDPYSIFARRVLGLEMLDPLDAAPGGAERGSALHAAVGAFAHDYPEALPENAFEELLAYGREAFRPLEAFPAEHALWWTRFERVAAYLVDFEYRRRAGLRHVHAEVGGALEIPLTTGPFFLTGRADRIEARDDGRLNILDFKTGTAPSAKQALSLSPQLPLEAAMAARGAFKGVPKAEVADLLYVELKGGAVAGAERPIVAKGRTTTEVADEKLVGLMGLLEAFEDERQGYRSLAAPQWKGRFGAYDHLARVKEWGLAGEDGE